MAAWLSGWRFRKKITVQHANIGGDLSDFPVYVKIDADGDIGGEVSDTTNGKDIRFTDADGETLLKYEREFFEVDTGDCNAHFWVKVPDIYTAPAGTQNEIYIYYNDGSGAVDGEDAENVWDANFLAVFHLIESGLDGSADEVKDSTSNGNHGVGGGGDNAKVPVQADGKVYKGLDFEHNDRDHIEWATDFTPVGPYTAEFWLKPETAGNGYRFMDGGSDGFIEGAVNPYYKMGGTGTSLVTGANTAQSGVWSYVVFTHDKTLGDGKRQKLYLDTSEDDTANDDANITPDDPLQVSFDNSSYAFDGIIDEVRFSDIARTADWIKFTYHNIHEGDQELTWAAEEELVGGGAVISGATKLDVDGEKAGLGDIGIVGPTLLAGSATKAGSGDAGISGVETLTVAGTKLEYDFVFTDDLISEFNYIENIDEVRNHIIIEGEDYTLHDELLRILDGTEIMYTLDDIPDGDSYVRMPITSLSAGKVIIAGCDAEVTDQMFTDPAAKSNIEAWMKAGDTTFINGGFIYTGSIEAVSIKVATLTIDKMLVGDDGNTEAMLDIYQGEDKTQILRLRSTSVAHGITQGGGEGYDWGAPTDCYFYMRKKTAAGGGVHMNSFTESGDPISFEFYAVFGNANNDKDGGATGAITLAGLKADPANHSYKACDSGDNILVIKTKPHGKAYKAVHIFDENGDYFQDGATDSFQYEDDVAILKDVEDILSSKPTKKKMKEKHGSKAFEIIHVNEVDEEEIDGNKTKKTGKKRLDRFISSKKLNMLLMGSIRQMSERIDKLEERL